VNNLYGWVIAMSLPMPKSGFKWKQVMLTEPTNNENERKFKEGVDTWSTLKSCTKNTPATTCAREKDH